MAVGRNRDLPLLLLAIDWRKVMMVPSIPLKFHSLPTLMMLPMETPALTWAWARLAAIRRTRPRAVVMVNQLVELTWAWTRTWLAQKTKTNTTTTNHQHVTTTRSPATALRPERLPLPPRNRVLLPGTGTHTRPGLHLLPTNYPILPPVLVLGPAAEWYRCWNGKGHRRVHDTDKQDGEYGWCRCGGGGPCTKNLFLPRII